MDNYDDFALDVLKRLFVAYREAARHKRNTRDEVAFEMNLHANLNLLFHDIMHGTYHPSSGIAFVVTDPVYREVFAAPFRDRIVHHFLYDIIAPWWDRRLCYDAYSCRVGKGTLLGVHRLRDAIRKVSRNYTRKAYVAKFDIKGYFMSLPRQGLYDRVLWGMSRQFPNGGPLYDLVKRLWYEVIFDDPTKGVKRRGNLGLWKELPKAKSLFNQPLGRGIVIGNLSSQLLSNIYLDEFDRFVKFELGFKYYGRYVDDFYIVVPESEVARLKRMIPMIDLKLSSMRLTLHPNKFIFQEASKGIPFLGFVVYPGRVVPSKRIRRNFYKALCEVEMGLRDVSTVTSYLGLLKHCNGKKITAEIFEQAGLEYRF